MASLEGTWKAFEAILQGNILREDMLDYLTFSVDGNNFTAFLGSAQDKGTIRFIPNSLPQAFELTSQEGPHQGKIIPAIYKQMGAMLTISFNITDTSRPTSFISTADNKLYTAKFKKLQ